MTQALAPVTEDNRSVALLKAIGLDRLAPEQRELALNIANRYDLDLLLKHLVMIDGRPYITRDGLLHIAHRSGAFDGIETTEPTLVDGFWRSTCSVYRKDMSHPFTYAGRYPEKGQNAKFAPEMAVKVGEVMSLRRAFDVAAPTLEERWDIEPVAVEAAKPLTLAEKVAEKAAAVTGPEPMTKRDFVNLLNKSNVDQGRATETRMRMFPEPNELTDEQRGVLWAELQKPAAALCGSELAGESCTKPAGHDGPHESPEAVWPQEPVE
jgi:hypothetical protein